MKKKKKYLTEFEKLLQDQRDTINLWWWNGKEPIDRHSLQGWTRIHNR